MKTMKIQEKLLLKIRMSEKVMSLTLMYITNNREIAKIADKTGVDRIFIDLETIGKEERQHNMDTVMSKHIIEDIGNIKPYLKNAEVLVRVNKIHPNSREEIEQVIDQGADIVMLPYFKSIQEIETFLSIVAGRTKVNLLLETPEAVQILDEILQLENIDEIHIGLNDLHLGYHRKFMFELLADGTVEEICSKIKRKKIKYGFGGIAAIGKGLLPAEYIICEHYRLGSELAILSRTFCNTSKISDLEEIHRAFKQEMTKIRTYEAEVEEHWKYFKKNQQDIIRIVENIVGDR